MIMAKSWHVTVISYGHGHAHAQPFGSSAVTSAPCLAVILPIVHKFVAKVPAIQVHCIQASLAKGIASIISIVIAHYATISTESIYFSIFIICVDGAPY